MILSLKKFIVMRGVVFFCLLTSAAWAEPAKEITNTRTLIRNASMALTMDPKIGEGKLGIVRDADVLFDGRIIAIGKNLSRDGARIIDAAGKIVMPGFVDVHNHLWQSLIRGCGADKELLAWLKECVSSMKKNIIDEPGAYAGVRLSAMDLIMTGVTTTVDISHTFHPGFTRGNLRALKDSGLRFHFAYCFHSYLQVKKEIFRIKKEFIDPNSLASLQLCSHPAERSFKGLKFMTRLSKQLKVPLNVHLLESKLQINDRPMKWLKKAAAFDTRILAGHVIHVSQADIAQLRASDVSIAHNPLSNMRLAAGVIPISALHQAGLKIGLGLDGGTNDTSDMFANMRAAVGLQRAVSMEPDAYPTIEDVLRIATLGGAEALHREDAIGSLTPGKKADIIVLDLDRVHSAPRWHAVNPIVFNARPGNVKHVFVDGVQLKEDGKLILKDTTPEKIISQAEQAVQRIKSKLKR